MVSLLSFKVLVFPVQAFKEVMQIIFQIRLTPWKKHNRHSITQLRTV